MTNSWKLDLSDDERFALMKLRRNVADVCTKPQHNDHFLLRWLTARKFDPIAAEKMLRESLAWRKEWDIDNLHSWEPPDALVNRLPCGLTGYDKQGAPVLSLVFSQFDVAGLLHCVSKNDVIRYVAKTLEGYIEEARRRGETHGPQASKLVAIFDMSDFSMKQYAWRPAAELVLGMIQMYEANYPEILKNCYVINAPKVFSLAWRVVKKFLHEYTISKIHLYRAEPAKWKPVLLDVMDETEWPASMGGTARDPDGDPRCLTMIPQMGKVPKSLYLKKPIDKSLEDNYTQVSVKKGEKLCLDYLAPQDGYFLKWSFQTEGHDIKFGVSCKDLDGNCHQIIPVHRVASHQTEEVGVLECPAPATYTITFDNTYSILRNKHVHYNISVKPPLAEKDMVISADATKI
uniref:SEC14-like protein 2 n=1 Tax=Cacopsylla melanoneura TaxID=428564 RepID=A0A8D8LHI7_9HEMI